MSWFKSASLFVTLLVATPAFAQQRPPVAPSPLRGYLIGGGGASFGTTKTSLTLNAEIAENMTRNLQAYMSVVFYDNIMSDTARNQLAAGGKCADERSRVRHGCSADGIEGARLRLEPRSSCQDQRPCIRMWAAGSAR